MLNLFCIHKLAIEKCETTEMSQRLEDWLALTQTPEIICRKSRNVCGAAITEQEKIGFSPYMKNDDIFLVT